MSECIAPNPGYSGYTHYGCRCDSCREARRERMAHRSRMIAYGRWEGLVDAEPSRIRVRQLIDDGLSRDRIAELAGLSIGCLSRLLYGNGDAAPCVRVRGETAKNILAVRPTLDDYTDAALVDATGTRRRIQALAAIGWSLSEQARRVGRLHKNYAPVLGKDRVPARLARMVRDLYEKLAMTPAPDGRPATRARRMAASRGWVAPLAWDDALIDDPAAMPEPLESQTSDLIDEVAVELALAGRDVDLTDAELVVVLQAGVARGEPLSRLAGRLGINCAGARKMLGGELTPRREKAARVEAELQRIGHLQDDYVIAVSLGVHRSTVTRARKRLAERQPEFAS